MSEYLQFVDDAVAKLIEKQSARLAGAAHGELCITKTGTVTRRYRSLGARRGNGFHSYVYEDRFPEPSPTTLDFHIWPILEKLHKHTGEARYADLLDGMVNAFADYGFDPRSGLAYFGAMTHFDVVRLGPSPYLGSGPPGFKFTSELPFEILWNRVPDKMDRMFKAFYWGMITKPETMDFNRYGYYGFDDSMRVHVLPYRPGHVAFAGAAAWMIEAWAFHFSKTGDSESLQYATAMTEKWKLLQNNETGLVPHFLGSKKEGESDMTTQTYCNIGDVGTALAFLHASDLFSPQPDGKALGVSLNEMGTRLIMGLAQYAFDPAKELVHCWLNVQTGEVHTEAYTYHFHSEEQKSEWVARDPTLADVAVHPGNGFFGANPSSWSCGTPLPLNIARAAVFTGDESLWNTLEELVKLITNCSDVTRPRNDLGQWTYPASASYISSMLLLYRHNHDKSLIDAARQMADTEMAALSKPPPDDAYEWWRWPFRTSLLNALLELDETISNIS